MEHLLLIACLFLSTGFWFKKSGGDTMNALISGGLIGFAILTRSEAVVFLPIFGVSGKLLGKSRSTLFICNFFGGIK